MARCLKLVSLGTTVTALAIFSAILFGCANTPEQSQSDAEKYDTETTSVTDQANMLEQDYSNDESDNIDDSDDSLSLKDIGSLNGVFVLKSDSDTLSACTQKSKVAYGDITLKGKKCSVDLFSGETSADICRSDGDKLIAVGDVVDDQPSDHIYFDRVIEHGYWQGEETAGGFWAYDTIENMSCDKWTFEKDADKALKEFDVRYCELTSDTDRTIDVGMMRSSTEQELDATWYTGTEYHEGTIPIDENYYLTGEFEDEYDYDKYHMTCPFKKTKKGFFEIDIASLKPGYYCFEIWNRAAAEDQAYVIEIS